MSRLSLTVCAGVLQKKVIPSFPLSVGRRGELVEIHRRLVKLVIAGPRGAAASVIPPSSWRRRGLAHGREAKCLRLGDGFTQRRRRRMTDFSTDGSCDIKGDGASV